MTLWLLNVAVGRAQTLPIVIDDRITVALPDEVTFAIEASGDQSITSIVLTYGITARTCQEAVATQAVEFEPGRDVEASWALDLRKAGSLPIGAEIWWSWELIDETGARSTTERQVARIDDSRFAWRSATRGPITLSWHTGDAAFGAALLAIADASLNRISQDAGLVFEDPIQVFIYAQPDEIAEVILFQPEWVGGLAFPEHNIVMAAIAPGEDAWAQEVLPHELMHLVSGALTFNCRGAQLPTWLSEGLSRFAEERADATFAAQVRDRALAGDLPPLLSLANQFSAFGNEARVSYEQSRQVVTFMIETYGADRMADLLAGLQSGLAIDAALIKVYDLDTQSLDSAWRASFGAPTRPAARVTPISVPTLALWTAVPQASATLAPTDTPRPPTPTPAPTVAPTAEAPKTSPTTGPLGCGGSIVLLGGLAWIVTRRRVRL